MATIINSMDLDLIYTFAIELGRYGGEKIKEGYEGGLQSDTVESKNDPSDLVTKYDKEIEVEVTRRIKEKFLHHKVIGEETDASGVPSTLTDDITWIIDPIVPTIGVVYNPILNELFTARKGHGAFINDKRLPLRDPTSRVLNEPSQCLILGEFGGMRDAKSLDPKSSTLHKLALHQQESGAGCRGIRCLGSAAMNLCMLAKGSGDAYWEVGPYVWDFAAGLLILQESGGFAISCSNPTTFPSNLTEARQFDLMGRTVLAVRSIKSVPTDRVRTESESNEADQLALNLLKKLVNFIDPVPLP